MITLHLSFDFIKCDNKFCIYNKSLLHILQVMFIRIFNHSTSQQTNQAIKQSSNQSIKQSVNNIEETEINYFQIGLYHLLAPSLLSYQYHSHNFTEYSMSKSFETALSHSFAFQGFFCSGYNGENFKMTNQLCSTQESRLSSLYIKSRIINEL